MDLRAIREITAAALVDERSVRRYLEGLPVRGLTVARIEEAARRLGLTLPSAPPAPLAVQVRRDPEAA